MDLGVGQPTGMTGLEGGLLGVLLFIISLAYQVGIVVIGVALAWR
jgi:hypothetical protein